MLLKPKRTNHSRYQKGRVSENISTKQNYLESQGKGSSDFCIIALESCRLTAGQIYALELGMKRMLKADGSKRSDYKLRVFPNIGLSKKSIGTRMGKGKGGIEEWVKRLKRGSIIIEFNCSNINVGKNIWKILNSRLPIRTKMLSRK